VGIDELALDKARLARIDQSRNLDVDSGHQNSNFRNQQHLQPVADGEPAEAG
jgi:hypothetical protein